MKKIFCIILLVSCFCGCSKLKGPAGIGILTGTETGIIAAHVLSLSTPGLAVTGAAIGFLGGSLIEDKTQKAQAEKNIEVENINTPAHE